MIWLPIAFAALWLGILAFHVWKMREPQATAAGLVIAYGALGFLSVINTSERIVPTSVELPNAAPRAGVAIDSRGDIYVGSQPLGRVQKYDRSGKFLLAVLPETHGGVFRMRVDESDTLRVSSVRPRSEQVFAPDGALLEAVPFDIKKQLVGPTLSATRDGLSVRADWAFVVPRVVIEDQTSYRSPCSAPPTVGYWPRSDLGGSCS